MSLRRKFPEQLQDMAIIAKEDLSLANHLSGLKKNYMKLMFNNTRDLMEVRKLLLPTVQKNRSKRKAQTAYEGRSAAIRTADSWLEYVEDIREYDVR